MEIGICAGVNKIAKWLVIELDWTCDSGDGCCLQGALKRFFDSDEVRSRYFEICLKYVLKRYLPDCNKRYRFHFQSRLGLIFLCGSSRDFAQMKPWNIPKVCPAFVQTIFNLSNICPDFSKTRKG